MRRMVYEVAGMWHVWRTSAVSETQCRLVLGVCCKCGYGAHSCLHPRPRPPGEWRCANPLRKERTPKSQPQILSIL